MPIHQAIFRVLGLEAEYRLMEIPRGELAERFPSLRRELDGMNVTIPYKEEVMPLLDGVDDFARQVDVYKRQEQCKAQAGDDWDASEIYFVYDELKQTFPQLRFDPMSTCAGLLTLKT